MSRIQKTTGVVLSVIKYSDSSKIANIYTKEFGRISLMVKGGRQKQSKSGMIIDPLNVVDIVFYHQPTREIQILGEAILVHHFPKLRTDFDCLKYGLATVELVARITIEHEVNSRMFNGLSRILERIDLQTEAPFISFLSFYIFILEETGFELNLSECALCNEEIKTTPLGFTWQQGIICHECYKAHPVVTKIETELFNLFTCLKLGRAVSISGDALLVRCFQLLEKFAAYHIPELKPLNALKF
ncbi:MAG: DNA repair protein RecO [Ignavibacteriales bacterium]|nr:DNA repair protein RecO [Ignavibacteriales bacterium]